MTTHFALRRGAPITEHYASAPDDPLGELTAVEIGLRRFCFDLNCDVIVEVGAYQATILLYPDISIALDDLPNVISEIAVGEKTLLAFPDSTLDLNFTPSFQGLVCTLSHFGTALWEKSTEVSQEQVLRELKHFYTSIIEQAITLGYIPAVEGQALLTESPHPTR